MIIVYPPRRPRTTQIRFRDGKKNPVLRTPTRTTHITLYTFCTVVCTIILLQMTRHGRSTKRDSAGLVAGRWSVVPVCIRRTYAGSTHSLNVFSHTLRPHENADVKLSAAGVSYYALLLCCVSLKVYCDKTY